MSAGARLSGDGDVRRLGAGDAEEAAGVLCRAFFAYPMWSWVLPDEAHRARALPVAMRASVAWGLLLGETYGVGRPLRGVAIWAPPGMADADVDPDGSRTGWDGVVEALGPAALARFQAMVDVQRPLRERHMPEGCWYLPWLGIDPDAQRTGAGAALLADMLARLDREQAAAYLETEHDVNVGYYARHGFSVVEEGVLPDGGPRFWCFLRRPAGR